HRSLAQGANRPDRPGRAPPGPALIQQGIPGGNPMPSASSHPTDKARPSATQLVNLATVGQSSGNSPALGPAPRHRPKLASSRDPLLAMPLASPLPPRYRRDRPRLQERTSHVQMAPRSASDGGASAARTSPDAGPAKQGNRQAGNSVQHLFQGPDVEPVPGGGTADRRQGHQPRRPDHRHHQ